MNRKCFHANLVRETLINRMFRTENNKKYCLEGGVEVSNFFMINSRNLNLANNVSTVIAQLD